VRYIARPAGSRKMTNESRSRSMKWICVTIVAILSVAVSEIIPYYEHSIYPLRPEYLTIPKFSPADAPKWSPGNGRSFIDLSDVHLSYKCDDAPTSPLALNTGSNPAPVAGSCKDTTFEILMFEEPPAKPWMDYWPNRQFCCTLEMVTSGE
jgi:hypothetical protein